MIIINSSKISMWKKKLQLQIYKSVLKCDIADLKLSKNIKILFNKKKIKVKGFTTNPSLMRIKLEQRIIKIYSKKK